MKIFLNLILLFLLAQTTYAENVNNYHGPIPICSENTCPYVNKHAENQLIANCDFDHNQNWWDCNFIFSNKQNKKIIIKSHQIFFIDSTASFNWLSDNLLQIFQPAGMSNTESLLINFTTMQYSALQNVFAVNAAQEVAAYDENDKDELEISKIFNPKQKILLPIEGLKSASMNVLLPDTHFDKNGNLVLVYQDANKNYARTTKVIAIDYSQLK